MATPLSRRTFLFAGASFATYGFAQEQAKDATFTSDVNVVNVFATVHDKQGKVVRTLVKDDFTLEDEGHAQPIKYFAQQSDLPLTLGLLIDTSGSQRNVLEPERHASFRFLEQVMRPDKDRAFVIHFDYEVELLQDLTSSRKDLESALDDLSVSRPQMNRRGQGGQGGGGGYPGGGGQSGGGRRGGGTNLYDAVLLGSDELMKKQQGRKALFVLSDGVDTGSRVTLTDAIESAQKSETLVEHMQSASSTSNRVEASSQAWEATSAASAWAGEAEAAEGRAEAVARIFPMERRFCSGWPKKLGAVISKCRASIPWAISTTSLKTTFAASTAWVSPRTKTPPGITSCT